MVGISMITHMQSFDHEIMSLIEQELHREQTTLNLIASENYVDRLILQATGSVLTNKYAEGYPGKRYYAGCNYVDSVELLAQERCKKLFNAEHVNVQPHAGSQANLAVFLAALKPGDLIMGMSLVEGGHLTHGYDLNISGKFFKTIHYTVDRDTQLLDYDAIEKQAQEQKPKLIIAGASAYSRTIDFERFASIAQRCNALFMADIAHIAGLVATQLHPTPLAVADFVTSTTHKTLRGPRGGLIMCKQEYAQQIDKAIMPGMQGGPFMHVIAAKAVAFKLALEPSFIDYQKNVLANAAAMAEACKQLGYSIVSGGTDTHLFVIDLSAHGITGNQAQMALNSAGITVSKSTIPFDRQKPWITSGIRLGTPAMTTRGIGKKEAVAVIHFIDEVLRWHDNAQKLSLIKQEIEKLCLSFPLYAHNSLS